ncbi:MAG TPA: L-threonylcarbamoyladenylate synthase [Flavipsychrobacter sp.]
MTTEIGTDIEYAAELLRKGEVVAIPTETVYGLAVNALDAQSVKKIYELKNRPADNPLIIHVADADQLREYVQNIPPMARALLNEFSPGPLTVVLHKKDIIPDIVTAGHITVAIRIPQHPLTQRLLRATGFPLAAPSANPFTYISPTTAAHVAKMFNGRIRYILDGGPCQAGIESTIIGFAGENAVLYRPGAIAAEAVEKCIGERLCHPEKAVRTPGMHPKHYSPFTPVIATNSLEYEIERNKGLSVCVITYDTYSSLLPVTDQVLLGTSDDMSVAMNMLYAALHDMDQRGYDVIIAKRFPEHGLGVAINDRLDRAAKMKLPSKNHTI